MKMTIDLPKQLLVDALRFTGAGTTGEAVVKAVEEFNRQHKVKQLVSSLGTWGIATNDEIETADVELMNSE